MNMKKALAAVLAVVIAISAMAVSVFAVDAVVYAENEIPLIKADPVTFTKTVTYKFDVPVYALYGYMTADNYLEVTLPSILDYFWSANSPALKVNWSMEVNGVAYDLLDDPTDYTLNSKESRDAANYKTFTQEIHFGYLPHGAFTTVDGEEIPATLPQSQMVGDTTVITFVAKVDLPKDTDKDWQLYQSAKDIYDWYVNPKNNKMSNGEPGSKVDPIVIVANDANGVDMASAYSFKNQYETGAFVLSREVTSADAYDKDKNLFLANILSEKDTNGLNAAAQAGKLLVWDHNLANRAKVMGTTTAKVVVETLSPITGFGFYNLYAVYQDPTGNNYDTADKDGAWWNIGTINTNYVRVGNSITVTSATKKLEFEINPEILYNTNYGVYNQGFIVGYVGVDGMGSDSLYWPYLGTTTTNYEPSMLKAYILVDAVEEEVVTPDAPLEGGDVEVDEDVEVEENPATGLVLAVLPMVIAAAAVVIFKR